MPIARDLVHDGLTIDVGRIDIGIFLVDELVHIIEVDFFKSVNVNVRLYYHSICMFTCVIFFIDFAKVLNQLEICPFTLP